MQWADGASQLGVGQAPGPASSTLWIAAFSYMMVWMVSPGPQGAGSLQKETQGCGQYAQVMSAVTASLMATTSFVY